MAIDLEGGRKGTQMVDLEKDTRRWWFSPRSWLWNSMRDSIASSTEPIWIRAILRSFLFKKDRKCFSQSVNSAAFFCAAWFSKHLTTLLVWSGFALNKGFKHQLARIRNKLRTTGLRLTERTWRPWLWLLSWQTASWDHPPPQKA